MEFLSNKKQQIISIFLSLCLLMGMIPLSVATAFAAETKNKAIMAGADQIHGAQADNLYFGTYQQSENGGGGYSTDPIKWRVLYNEDRNSNEDQKLFLLSDKILDVSPYHTENESVTWETSTIRSWLNGYGADSNNGVESGIDYTSNNFLEAAFAEGEQSAICNTGVTAENNPATQFTPSEAGEDTNDKVFLLSIQEVMKTDYGFSDADSGTQQNSRGASKTDYASYIEATKPNQVTDSGSLNVWWLRSPGKDDSVQPDKNDRVDYNAADVYDTSATYLGKVDMDGIYVTYDTGVRPAIKLDKDTILFASAAEGGKAATSLSAIAEYDGADWKATLLDSSRSSFLARTTAYEDGVLTVSYENAVTGTNEYISVMIADNTGAYTHYGRIEDLASNTSGSGTVDIDLTGVELDDVTVYVFNEQYNGGARDDAKLTDYGSQLVPVALTPFTVTFDANGHGTAPAAVIAWGGSTITEPTAPTETGWTFGGWYQESACSTEWDFKSDVVTGNITLYAKWTKDNDDDGEGDTTDVGDLSVAKTVSGSGASTSNVFPFTVTLKLNDVALEGSYAYALTDTSETTATGNLGFTDGVGTFELRDGQTITVVGLPTGTNFVITESGNSGYTVTSKFGTTTADSSITGTIPAGETAEITFNNYKSGGGEGGSSDSYTRVSVEKIWKLDDGGTAADNVTVALLRNGATCDTVTLNASNEWTYTWTGLNDRYTWTVDEVDVPNGFTAAVEKTSGKNFIITNDDTPSVPDDPDDSDETDAPETPDAPIDSSEPSTPDNPDTPEEPTLPQTGQLWWPAVLTLALGIALLTIGTRELRKHCYHGKHES